jgi:hypothetical protein
LKLWTLAIPATTVPVAPAGAAIIMPVVAPFVIVAPFVEQPLYDIDFKTVTATMGTLPSLHPRPLHANVRALKQELFEKQKTQQSMQSEEWGFHGLADQPAKYTLKSTTPWVHSPNPGQHHTLSLAAGPTCEA